MATSNAAILDFGGQITACNDSATTKTLISIYKLGLGKVMTILILIISFAESSKAAILDLEVNLRYNLTIAIESATPKPQKASINYS